MFSLVSNILNLFAPNLVEGWVTGQGRTHSIFVRSQLKENIQEFWITFLHIVRFCDIFLQYLALVELCVLLSAIVVIPVSSNFCF